MRFSDFVLLLNALWFGAAFMQFSIAQSNTLKILVPREERGNPIAPTLSASVAFLGAINLPLAFCRCISWCSGRPYLGCTTRSLRYSCSLPRVTSASSPTTFRS